MAVFTEVSTKEARELLRRLQLGKLLELRGIEGGIENTNYFVTCEQGEYVLTLFERLTAEQLPFYLHLMKHLAHAGIPVPDPQADKPKYSWEIEEELAREQGDADRAMYETDAPRDVPVLWHRDAAQAERGKVLPFRRPGE